MKHPLQIILAPVRWLRSAYCRWILWQATKIMDAGLLTSGRNRAGRRRLVKTAASLNISYAAQMHSRKQKS